MSTQGKPTQGLQRQMRAFTHVVGLPTPRCPSRTGSEVAAQCCLELLLGADADCCHPGGEDEWEDLSTGSTETPCPQCLPGGIVRSCDLAGCTGRGGRSR